MGNRYSFDPCARIWITPSHSDIAYTDGATVEQRLLAELRQCCDVSSDSEELRSRIVDWPSEYHLSPLRHNLLRPFSFNLSHRVLELGCGCGSITRYLGESGATVVAVEGSKPRAMIAVERCRDLPNVSVYCDNIADFDTRERFDVVTLIGVLEYARLFIKGPDPVQACIEKARSFLNDGGTLIVAIENQLGLKYFNGCAEDHTGVPFYGINGLYHEATPVTFGRKELQYRLRTSGLDNLDFYYPFPDYKLPSIILSDRAFDHEYLRPADMLHNSFSRDYGNNYHRTFHENLVWQTLERNALIPDLANSFLVLASKSGPSFARDDWLACAYSTNRRAAYATETLFKHRERAIIVEKRQVYPAATFGENEPHEFRHRPAHSAPYVSGRLIVTELQLIMARGGDMEDVVRWAGPWISYLCSKAQRASDGSLELPGEMLDVIPANVVRDENGALVDIDREWHAAKPIPLFWVVARGFAISLATCPVSKALIGITLTDLLDRVLSRYGQKVSITDHRVAIAYEEALQEMVFGSLRKTAPFSETLAKPIEAIATQPRAFDIIGHLQRDLLSAYAEIDRVKLTFSWQITKPFRGVAYALRQARQRMSMKKCG